MGFSCGIVGLPNVGKSTIFNCLTKGSAEVSSYPFCTINPNVGVVNIPDVRLKRLNEVLKPKELVPAAIEFVDIAGLVKGASHGDGLGNQFLAEIRRVDTVLNVVRCFENGKAEPVEEVKVISTELALSDLEMVDRRMEKVKEMITKGKTHKPNVGESQGTALPPGEEEVLLVKMREGLERGIPARLQVTGDVVSELECWPNLLTAKPMIIVANVGEKDIGKQIPELEQYARTENLGVLYISALIELELLELDDEGAEELRKDMGLTESALERLITTSFAALGLITFYTVVHDKVTAWTVRRGTLVPQAAGKVHSDMEHSFIKAEVISFQDFEKCGDTRVAKEKGLVRVEGKNYVVQDGDIMYFHFR